MKFNNTFAAILTVALTAGINVSAFATPINVETIKENRIETTENNKSDQNRKPSQEGSQGGKCPGWPWC
ncbi:MAG: hypothetical protein AB4060_05260 [Crocosphaera sp.]